MRDAYKRAREGLIEALGPPDTGTGLCQPGWELSPVLPSAPRGPAAAGRVPGTACHLALPDGWAVGLCKCHLCPALLERWRQPWLAPGSTVPPAPSQGHIPATEQLGCFCSSPSNGRKHLEGSPCEMFRSLSVGRCVTQMVFSHGTFHLIFPSHFQPESARLAISAICAVRTNLAPLN